MGVRIAFFAASYLLVAGSPNQKKRRSVVDEIITPQNFANLCTNIGCCLLSVRSCFATNRRGTRRLSHCANLGRMAGTRLSNFGTLERRRPRPWWTSARGPTRWTPRAPWWSWPPPTGRLAVLRLCDGVSLAGAGHRM